LEVLGDELGAVVGDDAWCGAGVRLAGTLQDDFHVGFLHFLADFPMNDEAAATVQDGAEEVKRAGDVEVADIDMPVFVRFRHFACGGGFNSVDRDDSTRTLMSRRHD